MELGAGLGEAPFVPPDFGGEVNGACDCLCCSAGLPDGAAGDAGLMLTVHGVGVVASAGAGGSAEVWPEDGEVGGIVESDEIGGGVVRIGVEAGRGVTAGSGLEAWAGAVGVIPASVAGLGGCSAGDEAPRRSRPHDWQLVCPRKIRRAPQKPQTGAGSDI